MARLCEECGKPLTGRSDRKTCSGRCRSQMARRKQKGKIWLLVDTDLQQKVFRQR